VKGRADVRVALGYLALLCIWCYDSPKSIKDFLSEGAHLQFVRAAIVDTHLPPQQFRHDIDCNSIQLIELISPSSKEDPMVQGLAAFLLGICYEFNWEQDALITRATIQPIILSRIGLDHFAACITRVRESKPFNAAIPFMVVLPAEESEGRLPNLFFDYSFVEFMKRTFGKPGCIERRNTRSRPVDRSGVAIYSDAYCLWARWLYRADTEIDRPFSRQYSVTTDIAADEQCGD